MAPTANGKPAAGKAELAKPAYCPINSRGLGILGLAWWSAGGVLVLKMEELNIEKRK